MARRHMIEMMWLFESERYICYVDGRKTLSHIFYETVSRHLRMIYADRDPTMWALLHRFTPLILLDPISTSSTRLDVYKKAAISRRVILVENPLRMRRFIRLSDESEEEEDDSDVEVPSAASKVSVLLGAQWGDEGKGKIIDFLIENHKINVTARCQGGNNAGHTVVANGRKYDFHILPSGIISPTCFNVIGNGVVVNLDAFFSELAHNGVLSEPGWEKRIMISSEAHLVFGVHSQVDGRQEDSLAAKNKIGTTNRGIGPTYSSKCFRNGIRVADLMADFEEFSEKYRRLVEHYKKQFPSIEVDVDGELARFKQHREKLAELKLVGDTVGFIHEQRNNGKQVLIEGANGALLDIDFGTYPYVTSSNSTVGGACTGLGVPPTAVGSVIGVVKAYQTRVGTGPFPTELFDADGEKLQSIGKEVGVTTGRKRRCGWIDLFLLRRSAMINGYTDIALTKLDILDTFPTIKVAVGYKLNGQTLTAPPAQTNAWGAVEVEYKEFEGWMEPTVGVRKYEDLPEKCRQYIQFIEEFIKVPIVYIGVGAERESLIVRQKQ